MGFNRQTAGQAFTNADALTEAMAGIGMNFAVSPQPGANIEDTLLAASAEGMENGDLRVLSVLVMWLEVHHPRVNADRLIRALSLHESKRVRAFWIAVSQWLHQDRRFQRLQKKTESKRTDVLPGGTAFQVKRKGEDSRFQGTVLRVPADTLRRRPSDVLTPKELATFHPTYRQRILMGPTYRADMWAALLHTPSLTAAELARKAHGSFATAWQVKRDFSLLH